MSGGTWRALRSNKTLQYGLPMLGEVQKEKRLTLYQLPQRSCKQNRHEIAQGESSGIGKESYEMTYKYKTKENAFRKLLIVGGSFGLREFTQIRYDAKKLKGKLDPALVEQIGKKKVSLEEEYEKLKEKDLDNWKNIRGPRPWEDSKSLQDQQRGNVTSKQS